MVSYLTGDIQFCLLTNLVMFDILITVQQSTAEFNSNTVLSLCPLCPGPARGLEKIGSAVRFHSLTHSLIHSLFFKHLPKILCNKLIIENRINTSNASNQVTKSYISLHFLIAYCLLDTVLEDKCKNSLLQMTEEKMISKSALSEAKASFSALDVFLSHTVHARPLFYE